MPIRYHTDTILHNFNLAIGTLSKPYYGIGVGIGIQCQPYHGIGIGIVVSSVTEYPMLKNWI
jgi:hypothetical protein